MKTLMKVLALLMVIGAGFATTACSTVSAEEREAHIRAERSQDRAVRAERMYNESLRK